MVAKVSVVMSPLLHSQVHYPKNKLWNNSGHPKNLRWKQTKNHLLRTEKVPYPLVKLHLWHKPLLWIRCYAYRKFPPWSLETKSHPVHIQYKGPLSLFKIPSKASVMQGTHSMSVVERQRSMVQDEGDVLQYRRLKQTKGLITFNILIANKKVLKR